VRLLSITAALTVLNPCLGSGIFYFRIYSSLGIGLRISRFHPVRVWCIGPSRSWQQQIGTQISFWPCGLEEER
jgi:hypothetical protein